MIGENMKDILTERQLMVLSALLLLQLIMPNTSMRERLRALKDWFDIDKNMAYRVINRLEVHGLRNQNGEIEDYAILLLLYCIAKYGTRDCDIDEAITRLRELIRAYE